MKEQGFCWCCFAGDVESGECSIPKLFWQENMRWHPLQNSQQSGAPGRNYFKVGHQQEGALSGKGAPAKGNLKANTILAVGILRYEVRFDFFFFLFTWCKILFQQHTLGLGLMVWIFV